jgi:hypothetical protein
VCVCVLSPFVRNDVIGRCFPHASAYVCVCSLSFTPDAGRSKAVDMGRSAVVPHAAAQGVAGATQFTCCTGTKVEILT